MDTFQIWTLIIMGTGVVVALVGVLVAYCRLGEMAKSSRESAKSNKISSLMAVLELEHAVAAARFRVVEATIRIGELGKTPDKKAVEFAELLYNEASEQYLNAADRLCSCIIRGFVDEDVYRRDYRLWIAELVKKYKNDLGPDTRHSNVLKVHQAWSDDKPARE